ncbi:MAG: ribonuclease Y [Anaerolineae bacterium]|nr:ribonuclease Y [Anaerolineae bacterium]MCB0178458.1 ribonuclease Y [Anaerolineae bacterium]MCB9107274.1 ribonuclease Y [Anaerolineales bacterium]
MGNILYFILGFVIALVIGGAVGYFYQRYTTEKKLKSADERAAEIVEKANVQAKQTGVQAKEEALKLRNEAEGEITRRRREIEKVEERLQNRQENLDKRLDVVEKKERVLNKRQSQIDRKANQIDKLNEQRLAELERISAMTRDEAKDELLKMVESDARQDMARITRQVEADIKQEADRKAREIIVMAMQRVASDQVSETVVSAVPLPSDDMKGRIIGRQGRNIRAFENATGVDVIVDDTPEAIILSGFDPVRREVARLAMSRLITDGRIHPARIEKLVIKAREEVDQAIKEAGEQAIYDAGVRRLHPEIIKLLGRLQYRTSYGQNQREHAVEASRLAVIIANEVGADVEVSREGALLHDIGKAVDHEVEGPHAVIGADIAKRYGVSAKVVNCIASHHHEVEQECLEAVIVEVADAISGARPGARRESLENYVKRIKALEEVAHSFKGVEEAFAIQAGREVRIIVRPEEVDDYEAIKMSKDIARQVEENLQYPGQIKVTVIRETRAVDYAK